MDTFVIEGGRPLQGEILTSGNKNAALPILAAAIITDQPTTIENLPDIRDVRLMLELLQELGASVERTGPNAVRIEAKTLRTTKIDPAISRKMRASFALAGPMLARAGEVELVAPGGDKIGRRPLDTHLRAFEQLGARVTMTPETYTLSAPKGLVGADIFLEEMSVLATENVIMAACLAKGDTVLRNAASEPHVQNLCEFLVSMGAKIEGKGTSTLRIQGQTSLGKGHVGVGPDYIEVGSFIALAALAKGELLIKKARPSDHRVTEIAFSRLGVRFEARGDDIFVPADQELCAQPGIQGAMTKIHDAPWPGFPPDLTSIAIVLATGVKGTCMIHEWMYESRLFWVDRLIAMGARIVLCDPHRVIVEGPAPLYGRTMSSPDIRAGMSLLIAALVAEGTSTIHNAQQIDRGYADIEARLGKLGAKITRRTNQGIADE